ncbi:hypothetical protein [Arthrobacter sp. NPDC089319]|uniref:hypothetical protein n=1 Tax=Arthrobacter sp. NPDC089319 TaxID=3155915 RepID=UPI00343D8BF9
MSEDHPSETGEQREHETDRQGNDNKGAARAWGSEPPAKEPEQPGQEETPDDARMAPEGVGTSMTRGGEEVAGQDGKEPGREDTGTQGASGRPTGTSTPRDSSGVDTDEASGEAAPQAP